MCIAPESGTKYCRRLIADNDIALQYAPPGEAEYIKLTSSVKWN